MPVALVIGIGSDIGRSLAVRLAADGYAVWGTFRGQSGPGALPADIRTVACDLCSCEDVAQAAMAFRGTGLRWDLLVAAAGTEEPVGPFWDCDSDAWDDNVRANALGPLRLLKALYPLRNAAAGPCVVFFSGAGTNGAAPAYSAYCASKILLVKMCELLDAESPDTSFVILGPGIVRTKIHEQTLRAGERAGANYDKVVSFLDSTNPGTSHDDIYDCVRWCAEAEKSSIGGRNVSLVHDPWRNGGTGLIRELAKDSNLYKLRRFGNDFPIPDDKT